MAAKLRCCPAEAQCEKVPRTAEWTTDDQCQSGYGGPLCTSCAAGHVSYSGECIPCEGGSPLWAGFVGLVGFGLVLFVVTVAILLKTKKITTLDGTVTMTDRVSGLASITISWLQILSSLTITYKMEWPIEFASYSQGTGTAANLDFLSLFAFSNCALAMSFMNKFLLQIMGPPIFVLAVFCAWLFVKIVGSKGKKGGGANTQLASARRGKALKLVIVILQLLYPKLSTITFQMVSERNSGGALRCLWKHLYSSFSNFSNFAILANSFFGGFFS